MAGGLIIAAPASGSGKTTVTLGLLRHLRRQGRAVSSIKVGPDYIDPAFHEAASGRPCLNLDPWAMRDETLGALSGAAGEGAELVIGEGVMGLFDGALDGSGSTADLAARLGWPVILVVDVRGMGASVAALVRGFAGHRRDVTLGGLICNRVGGPGHRTLLRDAVAGLDVPLLGLVPRDDRLDLPSRHLGLVQAGEHPALEAFLEGAADALGEALDVAALGALAAPLLSAGGAPARPLPPLGQCIAVARDEAFAFCYPSHLAAWRSAGAEVALFSPLADQAPPAAADAVFLPGGYPELHAGRIAANRRFLDGLAAKGRAGVPVYGECGGYMVLGETLEDAAGQRHAMAGLLPLRSSFADRRRHLGYRTLTTLAPSPLGPAGSRFRGHEFHYATCETSSRAQPWLACGDARGEPLADEGAASSLCAGSVFGSFIHMIDRAA